MREVLLSRPTTGSRSGWFRRRRPSAMRISSRLTELAFEQGWEEVTDDALLIEKMGIPIKVIEGSESNIKITTPTDLELADFLLEEGQIIRDEAILLRNLPYCAFDHFRHFRISTLAYFSIL